MDSYCIWQIQGNITDINTQSLGKDVSTGNWKWIRILQLECILTWALHCYLLVLRIYIKRTKGRSQIKTDILYIGFVCFKEFYFSDLQSKNITATLIMLKRYTCAGIFIGSKEDQLRQWYVVGLWTWNLEKHNIYIIYQSLMQNLLLCTR